MSVTSTGKKLMKAGQLVVSHYIKLEMEPISTLSVYEGDTWCHDHTEKE